MTQIRYDSKYASNSVIKKLKYINRHSHAFVASDLIL